MKVKITRWGHIESAFGTDRLGVFFFPAKPTAESLDANARSSASSLTLTSRSSPSIYNVSVIPLMVLNGTKPMTAEEYAELKVPLVAAFEAGVEYERDCENDRSELE